MALKSVEVVKFVKMRIGSGTAEFHFTKRNGDPLTVAIATEQLPSVMKEIETKFVKPAKPPQG